MSPASDDDEYGAYNLSDFTEEDFQRADVDAARLSQRGGPQIAIEIDPSSTSTQNRMSPVPYACLSPMVRHRRNSVLSVTDLASLAWCEVQYDYGLRGLRNLPIGSRPRSFISAQGKKIIPAKAIAVENDQRTKQGRALHKVLEREVKAEDLHVDISSSEELWGLRLINMLSTLQGISCEGYSRELPVFGILQGQVICGIIDEVIMGSKAPITPRKRVSSSVSSFDSPKSKKPCVSSPSSQSLLTDFLVNSGPAIPPSSNSDNNNSDVSSVSIHSMPSVQKTNKSDTTCQESSESKPVARLLHLIDTKTRKTNSLPADRDQLPSRIQLMLYYRLLHELTSLAPPFDFAAFWEKVAVDPTKTFSKKFLTEARLSGENASCLNDLSNAWVNAVHDLDITGICTELQLVYRLLGNNRGKRKGSWRDHKKRCANPSIAEEERALACAIEASLRDAGASGTIVIEGPSSGISNVLCAGPSTSGVLETPSSAGTSSTNVMDSGRNTDAETPSEVGTPLTSTIKNALQDLNDLNGHGKDAEDVSHRTPLSSTSTAPSGSEASKYDLRPIATKEFQYDGEMLDRHVAHALRWWHGERTPEGVSLEDSWRCRTCEYEASCEWREERALELQERNLGRR